MKAKEFFTQEWGTGFTKATLSENNGLLEMSMEDIYSTMEKYAELRLADVVDSEERTELVCFICNGDGGSKDHQGEPCDDCNGSGKQTN